MAPKTLERDRVPGLELQPLAGAPPFGARVLGLEPAHLEDEAVRRALYELWIEVGVIHFSCNHVSEDFHLALSECFGRPQAHVLEDATIDTRPELTKIRYLPDDGWIDEVDGRLLGGWLPWHSDLKYTDKINRGGLLRPVQLPKHGGGSTGYIDLITAYDRLPDRLKERIEGLHAVYAMDLDVERRRFGVREMVRKVRTTGSGKKIMSRRFQYPRVMHPMVYTQSETGRKVLNVSPWFALGIYELGDAEGDALLEEVVGYCIDDANAYHHDWQAGDMVLWDNWRTLHSAEGVKPDDTRVLVRTILEGDYALGRKI